ncbi:hypothetical protein MKW98_021354, partial [Papaver atlanticum]
MGKASNLVDDDENRNQILDGAADKKEPSMVEEAPYVIVVHGPPKSLIKHYLEQNPDHKRGPNTVLT